MHDRSPLSPITSPPVFSFRLGREALDKSAVRALGTGSGPTLAQISALGPQVRTCRSLYFPTLRFRFHTAQEHRVSHSNRVGDRKNEKSGKVGAHTVAWLGQGWSKWMTEDLSMFAQALQRVVHSCAWRRRSLPSGPRPSSASVWGVQSWTRRRRAGARTPQGLPPTPLPPLSPLGGRHVADKRSVGCAAWSRLCFSHPSGTLWM